LRITHEGIEKFSIAHVGSLEWYPNLDGLEWFLNNIFPLIIKIIPESKLYIYGSSKPKGFVFPDEVAGNIIWVGFVENLWKELANKSVCVVPLRIGSGIRIKILELMTAGIPVVTTSIGKEGIDAENGIHLLIEDEAGRFSQKIIDIFDGKIITETLILKSRELIKSKYTWDIVIEKFEKVLREVTKHGTVT
jgi:glycosyltransferase involved in cell wall biosynthesis